MIVAVNVGTERLTCGERLRRQTIDETPPCRRSLGQACPAGPHRETPFTVSAGHRGSRAGIGVRRTSVTGGGWPETR